jgi:hypothetical protein
MMYNIFTIREVNRCDELMFFVLIEQFFHATVDVVQTDQELGVRWSIHLTYTQLS